MNKDLEATLDELGPDYRDLVVRLKSCREPDWDVVRRVDHVRRSRRFVPRRVAATFLVAASAMVAFAFFVLFKSGPSRRSVAMEYVLAYECPSSVEALIKSQNPDGSWGNDFLTRQNAAALRKVAGAETACRKAMRYLKMNGLVAFSDEEMRQNARRLRN